MSTIFRLINESDITPALDAAILELLSLANSNKHQSFTHYDRDWHGVKPAYCTLVELDSQLIAYAGVVDRTIRVDPPTPAIGVAPTFLRIAGPQNVCVHPNHRGQSLSLDALTHAMNHALQQDFDAGLLFCTPRLERLYKKNGWQHLLNSPILRTENNLELPLSQRNIAMFFPLKTQSFPPGPIHLQGNDW